MTLITEFDAANQVEPALHYQSARTSSLQMHSNVNNSTDLFAQVIEEEKINIWKRNPQCSVEERNQMWCERKRRLAAMLGTSDGEQPSPRPIKQPRVSDATTDAMPRSIPVRLSFLGRSSSLLYLLTPVVGFRSLSVPPQQIRAFSRSGTLWH